MSSQNRTSEKLKPTAETHTRKNTEHETVLMSQTPNSTMTNPEEAGIKKVVKTVIHAPTPAEVKAQNKKIAPNLTQGVATHQSVADFFPKAKPTKRASMYQQPRMVTPTKKPRLDD